MNPVSKESKYHPGVRKERRQGGAPNPNYTRKRRSTKKPDFGQGPFSIPGFWLSHRNYC